MLVPADIHVRAESGFTGDEAVQSGRGCDQV
jgi:hypothetical protein